MIDGKRGIIQPNPNKIGKVIKALEWLAARPRVSGQVVEKIIGHCVHFMLLRRELLSVFRSLYDFKFSSYTKRTRLWASAAQEARNAAALLHICFADLRRPWDDTLTVSDASLSGYAVHSLPSNASTVAMIGRQR